jgi:hypothetical protein
MTNDGTKYQVEGTSPHMTGERLLEETRKATMFGEHLWVMAGTWKVDPAKMQAGAQALMDHESLLGLAGPGCYVCEEPYSARLAHRRCKGDPRRPR